MSHEFVAKNGIISQGNIVISGSITTTGGITVSGSIASASYSLSSSYASSSTSASYAVSSSYAYNSTLHNGTASAVFATTGSNNLVGDQHITSTTIANAFTSTASIYTDGGLQVTKDAYFSSSMFIKGNLTIYGTQSIAYITSSQLNIATNLITVNTATPAVRFGGLAVYDSGSTGTGMTGSLLWDSQNNNWIYDNPSGSCNYDSAMVIMGPRNASALGSEQGLSCNYLVLGHGSHHTTSSMVFHDGSTTCLPGTLNVNPGSVLSRINLGYNFCIENDQSPEITSFINSSGTSIFRWMQGTSPVEKMRLSNVGYLGIGTSSPTTALYVSGSGDTTITINVSGANNPRLKFSGGAGVINRGSTSDAIYLGETADTGNYFFRGSGVVGINASSATTDDGNLVVAGAVGTGQGITCTNAQINIWETTSGNKAGLWFGAVNCANVGVIGSRTATGNIAFQTYCAGWGERMRITYNGNVGIANNSPSSFLYLGTYASSGKYIDSAALPTSPSNYLITLSPPSTTNYYGGGIAWSEGTCVAAAINAYDDGAGGALGLSISTGTNNGLSERVRITSGGVISFTCQICTVAAVTADLRYTGTGYITYDTSVSGTSCLIFRQNGTEKMRISECGYVAVTGNEALSCVPYLQGMSFGWNRSNGQGESMINWTNAGGGNACDLTFNFKDSTTLYERMRLSSTGIACFSSTSYNIANFNSTYGQANINIQNNGSTFAVFGSGVSTTSTAGASDVGIGTAGLNNAIVFATGTGYLERMRITGTGNVVLQGNLNMCYGGAINMTIPNGNNGGSIRMACCTGANEGDMFLTGGSGNTGILIAGAGHVGIGTVNMSTEGNLFLGAKGTSEGGQLVLQKATSYSCATHLDNYVNQFRVLGGSDVSSTAVHFAIDHTTRCATFYGNIRQTASSGALVYQRITGVKAAAGSGTAVTIAYVGHTHAITVRAYARLNDSNAATITQTFSTAYGSSSAGTSTVSAYNQVSGVSLAYNNSGYVIQVTPTYSTGTPDIYFVIEGISHTDMYAT